MATKSSDDRAGELVIQKQLSYAEIEKTARAFVASGMFGRDMDKISKGITKIMAGQELGLAPFASMRAVHVIEGNATLSANTMAGMVKSSGRYDYEVKKKEMDECVIDFFEIRNGKRTKIGTESFNNEEAKAAGLLNKQNWQKYPKAMMFARCISNGVRTYCPDVFSGMLVYTPDELNATVGADGNVIDMDGDGNITNMPEQKKSSEREEAAQDGDSDDKPGVPHDPSEQDGSEEVSSAHEPEPVDDDPITEEDIDQSAEQPAEEPEEEPEPPIQVDDDLKEATVGMIEQLGLSGRGKIALVKDVTGSINPKMIKSDQKWRDLYHKVMAYTSGDESIPDDWKPEGQEKLV